MAVLGELHSVAVESVSITSRRYLGNKASIAPWIVETVVEKLGRRPQSVADVFAGTGSVAAAFDHGQTRIHANDLLYSNYVCLYAWLRATDVRPRLVQAWLGELNALRASGDNYASEAFGGRYWSVETARRIGAIRESIDSLPTTHDERMVLLASLLYAADRIANTCGHYDAFRQRVDRHEELVLRLPESHGRAANRVTCVDANVLARSLSAEVVYLDPPYNSRQYSDTYHVLENIARWEKPPIFGVARKMDRSHLKSRYCTQQAEAAFADLVAHLDCHLLVVSYNNMGTKGDPRSNACMRDEAMLEALSARGPVEILLRDFRAFNAGKRPVEDLQERLFVCRPAARMPRGVKERAAVNPNRAVHGSRT